MYNNHVIFFGVKKTTITLFSIPIIFAVLIIATIILLIGNYTKNLNSGINLEPQTMIPHSIYLDNQSSADMVWVLSDSNEVDKNIFNILDTTILSNQIVLAIKSQEKPTGGYKLKLNSVKLRGQRININYQINSIATNPTNAVTTAITYPGGMFTISKDKLPVGVSLEFAFYNQATKTEIIINKTITL